MLRLVSPGTARRQVATLAATRARDTLHARAVSDNPAAGLNGDAGWSMVRGGNVPTVYQGTGREVRIAGWERHPVVMACVRVVADMAASIRIQITRDAPGDDGEVAVAPPNHPAQQLLNHPRVGMNAFRFRHLRAAHLLTYGNAFTRLHRDRPNGLPTTQELIHPEWIMYAYLDPETLEPAVYEYRNRIGAIQRVVAADFIHHRDLTLDDPIFGYPRGAAALLSLGTDIEASQYVRQVVSNDGSPSLVFAMNPQVSQEDAKAAEARWHELMSVRGGRGRARFMPGLDRLEKVGFTLNELEFPNLRQVSREDICAAFGVDPRMIAVGSATAKEGGMSGQQYEEARRRLFMQTVKPLLVGIVAELDTDFCPEFGYVSARIDPDDVADITLDPQQVAERAGLLVEKGLASREEGRKSVGLPETMKPTDTLVALGRGRAEYTVAEAAERARLAANGGPGTAAGTDAGGATDTAMNAALGTDGSTAAGRVAPSAISDLALRVHVNVTADGAPTPSADATRADATRADAVADAPALSRVVTRGVTLTAAQIDTLWQAFDAKAKADEPNYERTALLCFDAEREGVTRVLDAAVQQSAHAAHGGRSQRATIGVSSTSGLTPAEQVALDDMLTQLVADYGPNGSYYAAWVARFQPLITTTTQAGAADLAALVGVSFDLANPLVIDLIRTRTLALAGSVTQTTMSQIQAAIATGRAAGMGIPAIAQLIQTTTFGAISAARALTIARTEVVSAMNAGEFLAAKASGYLTTKTWLSQRDNRVRVSHVDLDGITIDLSAAFRTASGTSMMHPGDPAGGPAECINCRCTALYGIGNPASGAPVAGS